MLFFYDFIQVYVFTTNHHLNIVMYNVLINSLKALYSPELISWYVCVGRVNLSSSYQPGGSSEAASLFISGVRTLV